MQISEIQQLVADDLKATDQLILASLSSEAMLANEIAEHIIKSGGKRIRPLLVLLVAKALNYEGKEHLKLAAIVELLHTATLLHDDVIDESSLRRGRPTANNQWGNEASVLVGDLLYSRSFQLLTEIDNNSVSKMLANAGNLIVEGEILQLMHCHDPNTTEETYLKIIERKTGQLFAASTSSTAILMNIPQSDQDALFQFGIDLGTAFQMLDDALDYDANPEETGKNIGDDLQEGKPTLPLLYILKNGSDEQKALVQAAMTEQNKGYDIGAIKKAIDETGAIDYTKQRAREYVEKAISHLDILAESDAKKALAALANLAGNRTQ